MTSGAGTLFSGGTQDKPNPPSNWEDTPASYHNRACGFSFADSHAEIHRWQGNAVVRAVAFQNFSSGPTVSTAQDRADIIWLIMRTSVHR
jgi:hypothetical protein